MSGISLQNLSGLIIDDQPEMCKQLYLMLERLGLKRILTCENGERGMDALSKSNFDIVLCDYDFGRGKDGLQILEEIKHREIMSHTSCFIMITAVQTGEMVLGAIEYQPDAYIVKPITFDDLRLRLERTLNIKNTYYDILHNLDTKNYSAALSACDQLTKSRPKLSLTILKHKAKIFFYTKQYQKAELIYSDILQIRKLPWAYFGLAKAFFHQEKLNDAASILQKLIQQNNNYTTAYDLLATIKDRQGDKRGAQKVLEAALQYSPRAIRRQTYLSKLATENQDWDIAAQASRKGIDLGRYSCFKSPDNYIHLSAALKPRLQSESLSDRRSASSEILKTMDNFKKDFHDDANAIVSAHFIEGSTHKQMGQEKEGEKHIEMATNLMQKPGFNLQNNALEVISQRVSLACDKDTLKDFIESDICKNLSQQAKDFIDKKNHAAETEQNQEKIDRFNNKGVEFFEKGAHAEAIHMFEQATEYATASYSVLLNAMQAHIAYLEKNLRDQSSLTACNDLLSRLNEMPPTDRRQARKKRLESIFTNLKRSGNNENE